MTFWSRLSTGPSLTEFAPKVLPPNRSWILAIAGLRVEANIPFARTHKTGDPTPTRTALPQGGTLLAGWSSANANANAIAHADADADANADDPTFRLRVFADDRLLGQTHTSDPLAHAYGNVFAKWESRNNHPTLIECGVELTAFAIPIPGVKHHRVLLATWSPDDPTRPQLIRVVLDVSP